MPDWIPLSILSSPLWIGLAALPLKAWARWRRQRRFQNPRPPAGATVTIEGEVQSVRLVKSPLSGLHGVVTFARVAATNQDLRHPARCAEVWAAADFVLLTATGPVLVRTDDVWIAAMGEASGALPAIPSAAVDALRAAGLGRVADDAAELPYVEVVVFSGDRVRVTGILRHELPPPELSRQMGYRDAPTVPTLSGGGGALRID